MSEIQKNLTSESIKEIVGALCKVQLQLKPAIKDTVNPFHKSKYADLNSVFDSCRELLGLNNLCIFQQLINEGTQLYLTTTLAHSSGEWFKSIAPIATQTRKVVPNTGEVIIENMTPQQLGSSITYMRRYSISALVGICSDDDDDGNSSSQLKNKESAKDQYKNANQNNRQQKNDSSTVVPPNSEVSVKIPVISIQQLKTLEDMIGEDRDFRACVMQRLAKNGIRSIPEIPDNLFQRVYDSCFEHNVKKEMSKLEKIESSKDKKSPSVFDKD